MLYVQRPPNPAAGKDWIYTIPGQYVADLRSVTATLTTATGTISTAFDASGNGRDGTYLPSTGRHVHQVPGLVAGDLATDFGDGGHNAALDVNLPASAIDWSHAFTFECWLQAHAGTEGTPTLYFSTHAGGAPFLQILIWEATGAPIVLQTQVAGQRWEAAAGALPTDTNVHHLVVTRSGNAVIFYVDGVAVANAVNGTAPGGANTQTLFDIGGFGAGGQSCDLILDEVALYPAVLSAARVAAHYAAAFVDFSTYVAAVMADTPGNYYHLDDTSPGNSRTPSLRITDGTTLLAELCTGFPAITTHQESVYSWIVGTQHNTQTIDATTTMVGVPHVILPAGYTLGTYTPDLGGTDQWSSLTIWFDDDTGDRNPGAYTGYRNVLLLG